MQAHIYGKTQYTLPFWAYSRTLPQGAGGGDTEKILGEFFSCNPPPLRRFPPEKKLAPPVGIFLHVTFTLLHCAPQGNLLLLAKGEKMGFHPMCLYSKYSEFSGEFYNG